MKKKFGSLVQVILMFALIMGPLILFRVFHPKASIED